MSSVASPIRQQTPYGTKVGQLAPDPRNFDDVAVICSISDMEWEGRCGLPPTDRIINACKNGEPYALTMVYGQLEYYDMGDDKKGEKYWSAHDLAESLLCRHNADASLEREGVFLCAGSEPTGDELAAALDKRNKFFLTIIQQADTEYGRNPMKPELISDRQRRAVKTLGLKKPYVHELGLPTLCPSCGEDVKPEAAKCRFCGHILNQEKWNSLQPPIKVTPKKVIPESDHIG